MGGWQKLTGSGDGERTLDRTKLFVSDEGRVGHEANVNLVALEEAGHVLKRCVA